MRSGVRLPLVVEDVLELRGRRLPIRLEINDDGVTAFLQAEDDFFAAGKTIKEARESLAKALEDELAFFKTHRAELGPELQAKYRLLRNLLGED